jgi:hypothetical protein
MKAHTRAPPSYLRARLRESFRHEMNEQKGLRFGNASPRRRFLITPALTESAAHRGLSTKANAEAGKSGRRLTAGEQLTS